VGFESTRVLCLGRLVCLSCLSYVEAWYGTVGQGTCGNLTAVRYGTGTHGDSIGGGGGTCSAVCYEFPMGLVRCGAQLLVHCTQLIVVTNRM